jgi:hypothetical protein
MDQTTAIAIVVALLAIALGWASRGNLNVDGVAYLDLAGRLLAGDWRGFVQGYWSPAYPALLALGLGLTGLTGADAAVFAHLINVLIALVAIGLTWRLARRRGQPLFARFAFTALLVASARTLRLDAVTPDLLLLVVMIGLATELLRPDGFRALPLGLWAGASFLTKTSMWPWLLITGLVGLWLARRDGPTRRRLAGAAAVALALMLLWIVPMSVDVGHPTIGDTGRYGFDWYLERADGRSPDTHRGDHRAYTTEAIGDGHQVRVAHFATDHWTWEPWSDPSAWQRGVISETRHPIEPGAAMIYWLKLLRYTVGVWAAPLLVLVVAPLALLTWRDPTLPRRPPPGALMLLIGGGLGVLQFIAVHAEPRLIAPFLMLLGLGAIAWRTPDITGRWLGRISWLSLGAALVVGVLHIPDQLKVTASTAERMRQFAASPAVDRRVVVIGAAFPLMPDLYRANLRVVAQIFDPPATEVLAWPTPQQNEVARLIRATGTRTVWISKGRAGYRIAVLPAPPP